jgi:hypothetical protein
LTETLVAVAILALSIGGVSWALQVLGRWQSTVSAVSSEVQSVRAAQAALDRLFSPQGPFRSDKPGEFTGGPTGFSVACGEPQPCTASLVGTASGTQLRVDDGRSGLRRFGLPNAQAARFVYRSGSENLASWPPVQGARQVLASVAVMAGDPQSLRPILDVRISRLEPGNCAFDVVLQDCR